MSNPFAGTLLNHDGAIRPKPDVVDVKPRRAETMVTPYLSQISAPEGNYVPPEDARPEAVEVIFRPTPSEIHPPTGNHQPPAEIRQTVVEVGGKPFYLKLRDDLTPVPENPQGSIYITSGVGSSDPWGLTGLLVCPVDGSPLSIVGSQHGSWICSDQGHQFDVSNQAIQSYYILSPTLPQGPAAGDQSGVENL